MRAVKMHEPSIGASSDWFTPPEYFKALGLEFDLDPCSPGPHHWVPAREIYTVADDGLRQPWHGRVFMNPPFGARNGHVPWLIKFLDHANGIAIVRAYTSSGWFHAHVLPRAEPLCFPRGKTKFIRPDGSIGKAPGHGVVLIGMGKTACAALLRSGLGFCARVVSEACDVRGQSDNPAQPECCRKGSQRILQDYKLKGVHTSVARLRKPYGPSMKFVDDQQRGTR